MTDVITSPSPILFHPPSPSLRLYTGVFLTGICSAGVALNVAAVVLLSLHKTLLAKNQRITVLNVAVCDLVFALLGLTVSSV